MPKQFGEKPKTDPLDPEIKEIIDRITKEAKRRSEQPGGEFAGWTVGGKPISELPSASQKTFFSPKQLKRMRREAELRQLQDQRRGGADPESN